MTNKVDNKPCQELNKKFDPIDWVLGHDVDTVIDNYKHQFSKMARNKYTELLEELQMLQKENKTLQQTIDLQHETTISDLKLIGKLQQENKYLIELCKGLFVLLEEYLNEYGGWSDDDIIGIEKCYKAIMRKHNIETT